MGSIPLALLREALRQKVKVVLRGNASFLGRLDKVDGGATKLNLHLSLVHYTSPDGHFEAIETAIIRGSQVKWIVLPSIVKEAPQLRKAMNKVIGSKRVGAASSRKRPREE